MRGKVARLKLVQLGAAGELAGAAGHARIADRIADLLFAASRQIRISLSALVAGLALSACATGSPTSYMGIDLAATERFLPARTYAERLAVQSLARRAQAGDKHAQLELGIRFEEGRGVERNVKRAKKLYGAAAKDSGGTIWVYSPPVGNGTTGRTIPVDSGPKQHGLAEAKERLERLE